MVSLPVLNEFWCTAALTKGTEGNLWMLHGLGQPDQAMRNQGCVHIYILVNRVVLAAYHQLSDTTI